MSLFPINTGAEFSPCDRYRYALWRRWAGGPAVAFIMLNPSTADETRNDPTVERCQRRAMAIGYGALLVANLFALRATVPWALYHAEDPVGPGNDGWILELARGSDLVVCAGGNHGRLHNRGDQVSGFLAAHGIEAYVLRITAIGEPAHPLYIGYDVQPMLA